MTTSSRQYIGRVEYLAHKKEIDKQLALGHSVKNIHANLKKESKITISYRNFCRYAKVKLVVSKNNRPSLPSSTVPASKSLKFNHNNQTTVQKTTVEQTAAQKKAADIINGSKEN